MSVKFKLRFATLCLLVIETWFNFFLTSPFASAFFWLGRLQSFHSLCNLPLLNKQTNKKDYTSFYALSPTTIHKHIAFQLNNDSYLLPFVDFHVSFYQGLLLCQNSPGWTPSLYSVEYINTKSCTLYWEVPWCLTEGCLPQKSVCGVVLILIIHQAAVQNHILTSACKGEKKNDVIKLEYFLEELGGQSCFWYYWFLQYNTFMSNSLDIFKKCASPGCYSSTEEIMLVSQTPEKYLLSTINAFHNITPFLTKMVCVTSLLTLGLSSLQMDVKLFHLFHKGDCSFLVLTGI